MGCDAIYIGSTYRALHTRLKEHTTLLKSSPIWKHQQVCKSTWSFKILSKTSNNIDLRIQEAIIIAGRKPSLNTKEDYQGAIFTIS